MPLKNKEFGFHGSFKPEGNTPHQIQRGKAANALRPHVEKHLKHALEIYTQKLEGTKLGKHYASLKVDSNMVDHFLDSKHGRTLASADKEEDNFNFHDQLRTSAGEFMSHYKPELHESAKQLTIKSSDLKKVDEWLESEGLDYESKTNVGGGKIRLTFKDLKSYEYACDVVGCDMSEDFVVEYEKYTDENGVTWNDEGESDKGHTNWGRKGGYYGKGKVSSSNYGPTIKSKFGNHKVRLNKSTGKWEKVQEEVEADDSITEQTSASGDRTITNSHTDKATAVAIREQLEQAGYDASVVKAGPVYKVVVEGMGRAATLNLIQELKTYGKLGRAIHSFWGHGDSPEDVVRKAKGLSDEELKKQHSMTKSLSPAHGSPQHVQKRSVENEMRKRGLLENADQTEIEEAVSDASVQAALDKNPIVREWFKTVGRGSNEPLEIKIVKGVIMITAIDTNDVATMMSDWDVELKSKSLDALLKMLKTDIEHHKTMKKSSFWS